MKYYGMTDQPGKHLGVAGLGGLGHVAVKFGKAFGLKVTVINRSSEKADEAINKLGSDAFIFSSDPAQLKAALGTMETYIVNQGAYLSSRDTVGYGNSVVAKHDLGSSLSNSQVDCAKACGISEIMAPALTSTASKAFRLLHESSKAQLGTDSHDDRQVTEDVVGPCLDIECGSQPYL